MTLIQTGKIRHFPVVLACDAHWALGGWLERSLLGTAQISPADLALVQLETDPAAIVALIEAGHARQEAEAQAVEPRP